MPAPAPDTEELLRRCVAGEGRARQQLLSCHHDRLRQMVAVRLDRRLLARLDPSDIVQEVLLEAHQKLDGYLRERPLPFYPWLHRLASERLALAHRKHRTRGRDVGRESRAFALPDDSAWLLAGQLVAKDPTPGHAAMREESRRQVREGLEQLEPVECEILAMRYLEGLSFPEIAAILGIREGAAKMRHLRAMTRMRSIMNADH